MCGRYTLSAPAADLSAEFGADVPAGYEPRFNIAPQQPVLVLGLDGEGRRRMTFLRWGLVPWWAAPADARGGPIDAGAETLPVRPARGGPINARAETVSVRPTFREAFRNRRCLILADGFYEWKREGRIRVPFRFRLRDHGLMAFAGLWESWQAEADAEPLHTCAIVTTAADPVVAAVHDRMPAILLPAAREQWLDPAAEPVALSALLRPLGEDRLEGYEVGRRVNAVANDSPDCIEPVQKQGGAGEGAA